MGSNPIVSATPTLYELYQQQEISTSGYTDPVTHVSGNVNSVVGGNANLVPEMSKDFTAGVVFTPSFPPGLTASVDYIHIKIDNAIGAVSGGDASINNLCQATGAPQYCDLIVRPGAYTRCPEFPPVALPEASQYFGRTQAQLNTPYGFPLMSRLIPGN